MRLCGNLRCRRYCRFCKSYPCSSLCSEYRSSPRGGKQRSWYGKMQNLLEYI